jgi:hypothetical protein
VRQIARPIITCIAPPWQWKPFASYDVKRFVTAQSSTVCGPTEAVAEHPGRTSLRVGVFLAGLPSAAHGLWRSVCDLGTVP